MRERCIWHELDGARRLLANNRISRYSAIDAVLRCAVNDSGELSLTIAGDNPEGVRLARMVSELVVTEGDRELWRGRLTETEATDFTGQQTLTAKGVLDYLHDTIIPPQSFAGLPTDIFAAILSIHNSKPIDAAKRFVAGNCNITASQPVSLSVNAPKSTWDVLSQLIKDCGGYLVVERNDNVNILHWQEVLDHVSSQQIRFGRNLLSLVRRFAPDDLATVMYAYGKEIDDIPLTIASVNNGLPYVLDANAVETYGWIEAAHENHSCADPTALKKGAEEDLESRLSKVLSLELSAVDLSDLQADAEQINVGDCVPFVSDLNNAAEIVQCIGVQRYIWEPSRTTISLGASMRTISNFLIGGRP